MGIATTAYITHQERRDRVWKLLDALLTQCDSSLEAAGEVTDDVTAWCHQAPACQCAEMPPVVCYHDLQAAHEIDPQLGLSAPGGHIKGFLFVQHGCPVTPWRLPQEE